MSETKKTRDRRDPFRFWHVRFWHGMAFPVWLGLLIENRFRISPGKLVLAFTITITSLFDSLLQVVQEIVFFPVISRTKITMPPIFIVGHWRSGTTLLHELLILDERFTYADTYQCMAPGHFLLTSSIAYQLDFFLPGERPMDDMALGFQKPQEDEFALVNLGQPSPYRSIAFPNETNNLDALTLDGLTAKQLRRWKDTLLWFLQRITVKNDKPIVVKSPTHTARIKTLLELFPDARFVFLARDPQKVFGSTVKLWTALNSSQSLQSTDMENLEERVLTSFEHMFTAFERDRMLIPENQFFETRYEDFVSDPVAEMEALYRHLNLGEFENIRPKIETYFSDRKNYRADTYSIDPDRIKEIDRRWGPFMTKYGYQRGNREAAE